MNKILRFTLGIISISALFLGSCKKPDETFPNDLDGLGGGLDETYTDTLTILARTVVNDSVRGDKRSWAVIGSFNDPVMGITTAGFYAAYRPFVYYGSGLGNVTSVDSVFVSLAYYPNQTGYGYPNKYKGQTEIIVYPIENKLPDGEVYASASFTHGKPLGSLKFVPRPFDPLVIGDTTLPAQVRIPLNKSLGEKLLANPYALASETFFEDHFYGLYFTARQQNMPDKGCFLYFNPTAVYSKISVYFTKDGNTPGIWEASIKDGNSRINTFKHNYGNSAMGQSFNSFSAGEQNLFLQPGIGSMVEIYIPELNQINPDKKTMINKAELIFPVDEVLGGSFPKPAEALWLLRKESDGVYRFLADYGSNSSDGVYQEDKHRYVFNITRHVNLVSAGLLPNDTLALNLQNPARYMERLVLRGTQSQPDKISLRLYYSKVP